MEARYVLRNRRSVRDFKDEKVKRDDLIDVLETSLYSPSWTNFQPVRYLVVEDDLIKNKIAQDCFMDYKLNKKILERAAGVIVLSYVDKLSGRSLNGEIMTLKGDSWSMFDVGVVANQFSLAAFDKNIATVILGYFDEDKISKILNLAENQIVGALIAYGIEKKHPNTPNRKLFNEVVTFID